MLKHDESASDPERSLTTSHTELELPQCNSALLLILASNYLHSFLHASTRYPFGVVRDGRPGFVSGEVANSNRRCPRPDQRSAWMTVGHSG